MATEKKTSNVYQRIHKVMEEMPTLNKNGENKFHNYKYAKESDYVEAIRPLLIKHGLIMYPTVKHFKNAENKNDMTELVVEYTIVNVDNPAEKVIAQIASQGQDKGDKGVFKAITGAKKYMIANTFMVATGDDPEDDSVKTKTSKPASTGGGLRAGRKTVKVTTQETDPFA